MAILGYGEDGLTYWGLTTRLQAILDQLGDNTRENDCTIFYRPSFGRQQFGEFDGILGTPQAVYLIESKWDNVAMPCPEIALDEVQTLRHDIFTWLRRRWQQQAQARNWQIFHAAAQADFETAFRKKRLPVAQRLLARNLAHILPALDQFPKATMRNVLLYFVRKCDPPFDPPQKVVNAHGVPLEFKLVYLQYTALGDSGYFEMVP